MSKISIWQNLIARYPQLAALENDFNKICVQVIDTLSKGGTLFLAGNGGSACDSEHLAGELLKGIWRGTRAACTTRAPSTIPPPRGGTRTAIGWVWTAWSLLRSGVSAMT